MSYIARNNKPYHRNIIDKQIIINMITDINNRISRKEITIKYKISLDSISKYYNIYKNEGINGINKIYEENIENIFNLKLSQLNVINNKHIPDIYKKNSKEIRLQLLAGFIDTDGYLQKGSSSYEISQGLKNVKTFDDIKEVAESIGFKVTRNECIKTCLYKGIKKECPAIRGLITGDVHIIPVKIERKKITKIRSKRHDLLKFDIKKIE